MCSIKKERVERNHRREEPKSLGFLGFER